MPLWKDKPHHNHGNWLGHRTGHRKGREGRLAGECFLATPDGMAGSAAPLVATYP